ncbi:ABC transporter substrate-binding protein [Micromonospora sp. RP3T]|uniref:ABC transporter substrate-binding protein n=1 Tax=Micromonospora sp. RP3T TaxID=2135446 RepID=UPI003D76606E
MTRPTPRLFATALAAGVLLLGGCAEKTSTDAPATGASGGSFPASVGNLTLEKRPEKIVSLSPTSTEMLFAIGAGKQVTAVDDQSNYPADAPKTDLSGYQPNAEAIAAKSPDLVVITNDTNKIASQLVALKIPVLLTPAATTLDDTYRQLTDLGKLTGHPAEADAVVRKMKDDIAALTKDLPKRAEKLTYYHELGPELYTATSKTFIGTIYALAGLENIADPADAGGKSGGYPQLSQEVIVKANPDFVFLSDTKCCKQSADTVKARSGWAGVTAVKNNQIVALDDDIASRWGPRVVELLKVIVDATAKVPA